MTAPRCNPPEPRLWLPPRRESLEDRPPQRNKSGSLDCLRVQARSVVQDATGVTTEDLARW